LIRPYALAGNPLEVPIAALLVIILGSVFVAELLTPQVVVGAFALLPLLAGVWMLSSRLAGLVAIAAAVFFGAAVEVETANRITVILLGVAILFTAFVARLYAAGLASALSSRSHIRPGSKTWVASLTLGGVDLPSYGPLSLTRREMDVARLGAEGYTAAEIGRRLNIGERTVESHLASAYSKLGIRSRLQLIRMAATLGAQHESGTDSVDSVERSVLIRKTS
jgi:DNA-binding CsgD family transcriptional regulator